MRRQFGIVSCVIAVSSMFAGTTLAAESDLVAAAARGDSSAARALLRDSGVDADVRGRDGMTALLWAAYADDLELARVLLEAGANANLANRYGITPLWLAATNRSPALVELLLEHGADPSATLPHGETALMAAARAGDTESIRLLLDAGADPNASESSLGETALMWAAAENHPEAVRALIAGGTDPNLNTKPIELGTMSWRPTGMWVATKLPEGEWTALMLAARERAAEAALALVEGGADLDAQDADGTTALGIAIMNAHYDLAAMLLELGADPNVADSSGMNALYGAIDMANLGSVIGRPPRPPLEALDALDVARLTLKHGADPNAQLTGPILPRHHQAGDRSLGAGATALMRAAKSLDLDSMAMLLDAGADPNLTTADGSNVLSFIESARGSDEAKREAIRLLVAAGMDVGAESEKTARF